MFEPKSALPKSPDVLQVTLSFAAAALLILSKATCLTLRKQQRAPR